MKKYISGIIATIVLIIICLCSVSVKADDNGLILVDSTAYYDSHGYGYGATGQPLVEGLTLAGRKEWIGKSAMLYDTNMNLIGIYEFRDTGYGQSTGYGSSKLLRGRSVGTIENGTCIDIYFDNYADCVKWGRRKVYMKLIEAVG